ncbi:MAG TPA: TauD/TfdA family dioxygenase [Thermoanaerobaculia bacterium]|nr:TauD/TfdA family dioxygenase [Thermoanaerobaculia bacterium]
MSEKPSLGSLRIERKAVSASQQDLVRQSFLGGGNLPLVLEPTRSGVDLISWAKGSRGFLESNLQKWGGILLRNFDVESAARFEELIASVFGEALEYKERSSPRSTVSGNIYTSTDYPPDQHIFLHNENSYAHTWPAKIFFCCHTAPAEGGETPIADVRKVYARIPEEVRRKFEEKEVLYVRNFNEMLGLPWQTVFGSDDPQAVEEYCRRSGYEVTWKEGQRLQTRRRGPAVVRHPKTGEPVWFNHATFFHVTTLAPAIRDALLALGEADLPNNTYYGDGSPIEPEVLDLLRGAYHQETVSFPWQKGDILMLDNMLVAHGRAPFKGSRKILVGMAEPIERASLRS